MYIATLLVSKLLPALFGRQQERGHRADALEEDEPGWGSRCDQQGLSRAVLGELCLMGPPCLYQSHHGSTEASWIVRSWCL